MDSVKILMLSITLCVGVTGVTAQVKPSLLSIPEEYNQYLELNPIVAEFTKYYSNITDVDLALPNSRLPSQQDLKCLADMSQLMKGLAARKIWALRMIDSWGSIPKGILYGNVIDMGNFDECIKINKVIAENYKIQGKYCMVKAPIIPSLSSELKIGVCFPTTCSAANMDTFLSQILKRLLNVTLTGELVSEDTCKTSDKEPLDGLTIFTIVLLSVLGALVVLATLGDYFLFEDQKQLPIVVRAFSMRANSRNLFRMVEPKTNPNVIDCLNGMRCMSLIWVIFAHQYIICIMSPKMNYVRLYNWIEQPFSSFLFQGYFSVDTFFFLSGLLLVMIALRAMEKSNGRLNVAMMYLHRYLRLTPLLAMAILVYMKILPLMSFGPIAEAINFGDYSDCERTWYLTLLYVQNYATENMCINHSWYLGVDMQLYILSPIFLIALYKWGKKAAAGIFVLMLLLSACLFSTMMTNKYRVYLEKGGMSGESQRKLYLATHIHAAPWLIGLLCGYFFHLNRGREFKLNRLSVWLGWIISLALIFTCIFSLYPAAQWKSSDLTMLEYSFFYTFTRIAWPLSLCWVVFACMQGYGGMANSFLSSPLWQPLSKLSYSAYIFHVYVQLVNERRIRVGQYMSDYDMMLSFWASFGFIIILSYVMHILLEAPFGVLEGMLTPKPKVKPSELPRMTKESPVEETPEVKKVTTQEAASPTVPDN